MRIHFLSALLTISTLTLSACGETPGCRAVTGAGIGAAGGAVIGALAGAPLTGAAAASIFFLKTSR